MKLKGSVASLAFAIAVNLALVSSAQAYIDPGTGTMILQVAGAMIAAGLFYLRSIRLWIAAKLGLGQSAKSVLDRSDPDGVSADQSSGD
jgi:hypothetical protein